MQALYQRRGRPDSIGEGGGTQRGNTDRLGEAQRQRRRSSGEVEQIGQLADGEDLAARKAGTDVLPLTFQVATVTSFRFRAAQTST